MKTNIFILLVYSIAFLSCSKNDDETTCNTTDPIADLAWLKEAVKELQDFEGDNPDIIQYFYVAQAEYNSQTAFIFDNCCPFCNTVVTVQNCEGTNIGFLNTDISRDDITNRKIIYSPKNFACGN